MENFSLSFKTHTLSAYKWEVANPKVNMLIVHGLGEHALRYSEVAEYFNSHDVNAYSFDQIGHGSSTGQRGFIKNYEDLVGQIEILANSIKNENSIIPLVIYAHSFGGNIAANYVINGGMQANGLVLSAPWFTLPFSPNPLLVAFGKLMLSIYPAFDNSNGLEVEAISRIPYEVKLYKEDKRIHDRITPALFFPTESAGLSAIANSGKIQIPTLVMHGTADRITAFKGSQEFCKNNPTITLKAWEGYYHELHKDLGREDVFNYTLNWLMDNGFLKR